MLKPIEGGLSQSLNRSAFLKIAFIIGAVVIGSVVMKYRDQHKPPPKKTTIGVEVDTTNRSIDTEILFPTVKKQLENTGGELASTAKDKSEEIAGRVLGEVSKEVEKNASKSADAVTDYVYQNTVGQVIKKMIESLPVDQQATVKKNICE